MDISFVIFCRKFGMIKVFNSVCFENERDRLMRMILFAYPYSLNVLPFSAV